MEGGRSTWQQDNILNSFETIMDYLEQFENYIHYNVTAIEVFLDIQC
jgi:hypothetical protein